MRVCSIVARSFIHIYRQCLHSHNTNIDRILKCVRKAFNAHCLLLFSHNARPRHFDRCYCHLEGIDPSANLTFVDYCIQRWSPIQCMAVNIRKSLASRQVSNTIPYWSSLAAIWPYFNFSRSTSLGKCFLFARTVPTKWVWFCKQKRASSYDV